MSSGYYRRHVFVCENRRDERECCANHDSPAKVKFLRALMKEKGMHGKGGVRINRAGCMDRCAQGPVLVVYPDAAWYRYESDDDLREIAERHLVGGEVVGRLLLDGGDDETSRAAVDNEINLSGLSCPLPVLRVKKALSEMAAGGRLRAFATDPGSAEDIPAFLRQAGHTLESVDKNNGGFLFTIVKR